MNKIKVITYENFPYGGAPANLLRYFCIALSHDNELEVILPTGNVYGTKIEDNPLRKSKIENVPYRHLGFKIHPQNYVGKLLDVLVGFIFTPIYLIRANFKNNFDTIVSYNTQVSRILLLILFKTFFRKKLILILPEFYEKPKQKLLALFHWYDFYLGLRYLSHYADGFFPSTHYLKNFLQNELKIKKPIQVLPNLMDPNIFNLANVENFKKNKVTIGYTGTPTKKDGVLDLIDSFALLNKKHPNTHLLIVGDVINGTSVIPNLKERAEKLGIIGNITFTGLVPFKEIPKLLNSCQILALTRPNGVFAEAGFPTKLGEYLACKKPVLVTRVGDIPLYFESEKELIITNPENIDDISFGFEKIITNKDLAMNLSANGYKWMNNYLNYRNISPNLSKFINTVSDSTNESSSHH